MAAVPMFNAATLFTLVSIANDPNKVFGRFQKIDNTHEYPFKRVAFMINGFVLAVISLVVFKYNIYACEAILIAATGSVIASIFTEKAPTKAYTTQVKEIDNIVESCYNGLCEIYVSKRNAIIEAVNKKEFAEMALARTMIQHAAQVFDRTAEPDIDTGPDILEKNPIPKPEYDQLLGAAIKLVAFKIDSTSSISNPLAIQGIAQLQKGAALFLEGMKKSNTLGEDSYVRYREAIKPNIVVAHHDYSM